jgi:hypothetical protein
MWLLITAIKLKAARDSVPFFVIFSETIDKKYITVYSNKEEKISED